MIYTNPLSNALFTVPEAALRLDVSIRTVYRRLRSGQLKGHKVGGKLRITEAHLAEHAEQWSCGAGAQPNAGDLILDQWAWLLSASRALAPPMSLLDLVGFLEDVADRFPASAGGKTEDLERHVVHQMAGGLADALRAAVGDKRGQGRSAY